MHVGDRLIGFLVALAGVGLIGAVSVPQPALRSIAGVALVIAGLGLAWHAERRK